MTQAELTRIGRYQLLSLLGEGGMARVFLAVSRGPVGFDKLVVVKQIRPELAWDQDFLTMFCDEARIAARLQHPNVIHTYEVVEETGQHLLVMEYLEGHTLSHVLRRVTRARMPLEEHLFILAQVLAGLHYAHELTDYDGTPLGLVHRDVSPSNVFVTYNGEVKLLDFGIAKAAGAMTATHKGTIKGKLGYGAPEQLHGDDVDARTDIFAVGVLLWEALAARRRKLAETPAAILEARMSGVEPRVREARSDVPSVLADMCDRAMAVNPDDRYGTAAEFQHDLERYLEGCGRRVGGREVAALLKHSFGEERLETRKRLEERVAGTISSPPLEAAFSRAPSGPAPSPEAPIDDASVRTAVRDFKVRKRLPAKWLVAAALLVATAIAIAWTKGKLGRREPTPVAAVPVPLAPAVSQAEEEDKPGTELIELAIRVVPASATVTVDGKSLGSNPFRAEFPKDRRAHVVFASAPGFTPVERVVTFSADLKLELALQPSSAHGHGSPRREVREAPADSTAHARTPEQPGADLPRQGGPRSSREIDEKDPYAP
jgi:serine/threonine protein kinase